MIGYLTGLIIDLDQDAEKVLLLAGQVGYDIRVTTDTLSKAKIDQKIHLFIHTAVREDAITLYGFLKKEELHFFNQLISVSGVGPKTALEILSAPISMTQNAILSGDIGVLTKIKGIGKKSAERLVLELKGKVSPISISVTAPKSGAVQEEAISALTSLGYERYEVMKALVEMPQDLKNTEEIIRHFLKEKKS
jgi:Holliday junction DNA helicase RuvA